MTHYFTVVCIHIVPQILVGFISMAVFDAAELTSTKFGSEVLISATFGMVIAMSAVTLFGMFAPYCCKVSSSANRASVLAHLAQDRIRLLASFCRIARFG